MKIAVFEVEPWDRDALDNLARDHDVAFDARELDAKVAEDHADAEAISTFIYSTMSREVLEKFPQLAFIATRSTGVDQIDIGYCEARGIAVAENVVITPHTGFDTKEAVGRILETTCANLRGFAEGGAPNRVTAG